VTNPAHRRILNSLPRTERTPLNEAQDYAAIFRPLVKAVTHGRSDAASSELASALMDRAAKDIAWAKRHLRRSDAITWYLRWVRFFLAHRWSDNAPTAYAAFRDDLIKRGGISDVAITNLLSTNIQDHLDSDLEHFMSLPIRAIQNYRFVWQTPDQALRELKAFEDDHNERMADSGPVRQIDPEGVWRTEQGRRNLIRATGPDYHEKEEVILSFPDGTFWLNLNRAYCPKEAEAMTHCGNSPRQHTTDKILSLRRWVDKETGAPVVRNKHGIWTWAEPDDAPADKAHPGQVVQKVELTFIIYDDGHLGEMKGPKNNTPSKRYHDHIAALLRHPMIKGIIGDGYAANMNFNITQMDSARRDALLADKPELHKDWFPEDKVKVVLEANDGWTWAEMDREDTFVSRRISIPYPSDTVLSLGIWKQFKDRRIWEHHAYALLQRGTVTNFNMRNPVGENKDSSLFPALHSLILSDVVNLVAADYHNRFLVDLYTRVATPGQIREGEEKLWPLAGKNGISLAFFSPKVYHLIPAGILATEPVNPKLVPDVQQAPYWRARAFVAKNANLSDVPEALRGEAFHGVTAEALAGACDRYADFDAVPEDLRSSVYERKVASGMDLDNVPKENLTAGVIEAGLLRNPEQTAEPRYRDRLTPDIANSLIKQRKITAFEHFPDAIKRGAKVIQGLFDVLASGSHDPRGVTIREEATKALVSLPYDAWQTQMRANGVKNWQIFPTGTQQVLIPIVAQDAEILNDLLRNHHRIVGERIFTVFSAAHETIPPQLYHAFLEFGVVPMTSIPPDMMTHDVLLSRVLGRREGRYSYKRNGGELLEARQIPMDKWTPKLAIEIVESTGPRMVKQWYPAALVTPDYLDAFLQSVTDEKSRESIRLLFGEKPELWTPELVASAISREIVKDNVVWMARGIHGSRDEVFHTKMGGLVPAVLLSTQVPYPMDETIAAAILKRRPTLVQDDDKDVSGIFLKPGVLAKAAAGNHKVLNYLPKKYLTKPVVASTLQAHRSFARHDPYDSLKTLLGKLPREKWGKKEWQAAATSGVVPLHDVPAAFRDDDIDLRAVKLDPYNMASLPDPAAWFEKHQDLAGPEPEVFAGRGGVAQTPEGWRNARDLPMIELEDTGWKLVQVAPSPRAAYAYFILDPAKNFVLFAHWKRNKLKVPDKSRFDEAKPAIAAFIRKLAASGHYDHGELKDSGLDYDRREGTVIDRTMTKNPYAWGRNDTDNLTRHVSNRADKGTIHTYRAKEDGKVVLVVRRSKNNDVESITVKDWTKALEASQELALFGSMASYQAQRLGIVSKTSGGWGKLKDPTSLRGKLIGEVGAYAIWQEKHGNRIGLFGPTGMVAFATMRKPTKDNRSGIWRFHGVYGFGELEQAAEAALERAAMHIQKKEPLVYSTTKPIPVRVREEAGG